MFKKKVYVVEETKSYVEWEKDKDILDIIDMILSLVKKDALVWKYEYDCIYTIVDDVISVRIRKYNDDDEFSEIILNHTTVSLDGYRDEALVLEREIKLSQKRQSDRGREENLFKVKETLRNKLKETP